MKKIIKGIAILCLTALCALSVIGCAKAELKSIYVESESSTIEVSYGQAWNFNEEIKVKGKLSNGETIDIALDSCDVVVEDGTNVANLADVVGEHQVTITYSSVYQTSITIVVKKQAERISVKSDVDVLYGTTIAISETGLKVEYSDGTTESITEDYKIYDLSGNELNAIPTDTHGENTIKFVYNGMETTFTYNVNKVITEVKVGGIYSTFAVYGTTYDYSGVTIIIKYSDASTSYTDVEDEGVTLEGIDLSVKGEQKFKVTFKGKTAYSEPIEVGAEISGIIYQSGLSDRIKYDLIPSTVKVDVKFSDGTDEIVDANITYTAPEFKYSNEESVEFTISFGGKTITKTAIVYQQLEELLVVSKTNTSNYILSGEGIDLSKFYLAKRYTKTAEDIISEDVEVSSLLGNATDGYYYTISLKEDNSITKDVKVFVINDWSEIPTLSVELIEIISGVPNSVVQGENSLDLSNVKLSVTYSNGITLVVDYNEDTMTAEFNSTVLGKQTLVITFEGKTAEKEVIVLRDLVSVTVKTNPNLSVKYGTALSEIDVSGMEFYLNFAYGDPVVISASELEKVSNDNLTRPISLINHKATVSLGFAINTENYYDSDINQANINIEIYEEMEDIAISGISDKVYCSQTEEYDISQLVLREVYTSGATVKVDNPQNYIVDSVNRKVCETQTFKIVYNGKEATLLVRVVDVVKTCQIVIDSDKTIYVGDSADVIKGYITLIPTFESGREVTEADYIKAGFMVEIDTTSANDEALLEVSYEGKKYSTNVKVVNDYVVLGVNDPAFVATYNTAKEAIANEDNVYLVGTQNPFRYDIQVSVQYKKDLSIGMLTTFNMEVIVKILDGEDYVELTDYAEYVTIDKANHTISFTGEAIDKYFEITASVEGDTNADNNSTFKFKVVKGFNVYDAYDLSVVDNLNSNGKWNKIKSEQGLLGVETDRVILHNNITVKAEHVPDVHFYKESEVNANDKDVLWGDPIVGSLKDHRSDLTIGYIYYRTVDDGNTFDFEGNCFQIDVSQMPLIYREEKGGVALPRETAETAITVHTAMFFIGQLGSNTGVRVDNPNVPVINLNEMQFFGNAKKSADTTLSGGVIGFKIGYGKINVTNNIVKSTYIAYLLEGADDNYQNIEFKFKNCEFTDAFQTLMYVWGCKAVYIDSCKIQGAGGPVIIADHVDNETGDDPNGGFPTHIYVDTLKEEDAPKSDIESFVTGEEGWFNTYTGSSAIIGNLKALDPLFNPYGKTVLKEGTKINLVAVYKSGSAEGLTTSVIEGSFNYGGHTAMSFEDPTLQYMLGQLMASGQQGMIIGSCNIGEESTLCMPGLSGWLQAPDSTLFTESEDYLYIYLFNGMVAVVGLSDLPTA